MDLVTKKKNYYKGIFAFIGGIMIHLTIGCFYLWGNIVIYVTSYFRSIGNEITTNQALSVFPIMLFGIVIGFPFGIPIAEKIGIRLAVAIEGGILVLSVFICSFLTNFIAFAGVFSIGFGFMAGLLYMPPIFNAVKFFPFKKGIITGTILSAFGLASFNFSFVAIAIVNPENFKPKNEYFEKDIASRVPRCLRFLSLYFLILLTIGTLFMFTPTEPQKLEKTEKELQELQEMEENLLDSLESPIYPQIIKENKQFTSIKEVFKTKQIYFLFGLVLLGSGFGLLIAVNFKTYGMKKQENDLFLTFVGGAGSVANSISRIFWGFIFDKFQNFRNIYLSLITLQCVVILTLNSISGIDFLYFLWVFLAMSCLGGHFALFPAENMKIYGVHYGAKTYGFVYMAFGIANFIQFFIVFLFEGMIGFDGIFWIYLGFAVGSFVLILTFREKIE